MLKICACFLGLLLSSSLLRAQQMDSLPMPQEVDSAALDTFNFAQLEELVVTSTRTARNISELPILVQTIDAKTIQNTGSSRLNEVLAEQTGLLIQPAFGGGEGVQLQGLDAAYTLILVDGLPLIGRQAGTLDLSRIGVANIERIELVKGASSALYGSEALAGVINIITKKNTLPNKQVSGNLAYRFASFQTQDANAVLQARYRKLSLDFFGNFYASKGYDLNEQPFLQTVEPYHNHTLQMRLAYHFSDTASLVLGGKYYEQNQLYKALIAGQPYTGLSWNQEKNAHLRWNLAPAAWLRIESELLLNQYHIKEHLNDPNGQLFEASYYHQQLFRPEVRGFFKKGKHQLITGFGLNLEHLDRTYFSHRAALNAQYVYAQAEIYAHPKLNFLFGFRYDHTTQFQSQLSPKLALNWRVSEVFSLKAAFGYGFKAPDFRQLYFDFTNSSVGYTVLGYRVAEARLDSLESQAQLLYRLPNLDLTSPLKPESGVNYNIGVFWNPKKLKIQASGFWNTIHNLIDTRVLAQKNNGQQVFGYFNLHKIYTYGLELGIEYKLNPQLRVQIGYQCLLAKDANVLKRLEEGTVFVRDMRTLQVSKLERSEYVGLFNRSKHTANLKISYQFPKQGLECYARLFYRSKYGLLDSNQNQILDVYDEFVSGYFLLNLSAQKSIKSHFLLQIGVNNLLNFTNSAQISQLAGRLWFAKIGYNF